MSESPGASQSKPGGFQVTSTSRNSATVSPLVLRQTDTIRLVFKPVLVNNRNEPAASVDGVFCYQRKRKADQWENVESVSLSSLRAGEGVKLDIRSAELLRIFKGLRVLYDTVARDGVPSGTHTYIQADAGSVLADVAALLERGGIGDVLQTFLAWAKDSQATLAEQLAGVDTEALVNFDAAIGVARLSRFIKEATSNLGNNDEGYWQDLLRRESWVISQIYATPMIIVREQAYVGGKSIDNRGGSIVDYMFANSLTENALIVEIKTPPTPLLKATEYRNGIYGPSTELGGATQQVLHARQTLQEEYLTLTQGRSVGFNIFGTRALLVLGTMPQEADRIRSFEIYRNAQRGIEIVTFDELIAKAQLLLDILSK